MLINPNTIIDQQLQLGNSTPLIHDNEEYGVIRSGHIPPLPDTQRQNLNGAWQIKKGPIAQRVPELLSQDTQAWPSIQQPSIACIADPEVQPADIPNWQRRFMKHMSEKDVVVLRKQVLVPKDWAGLQIFLHLAGVYPAADIYLNGQLQCEHRSGITGCAINCDGIAQPDELLDVAVVIIRKYPFQEIDMPRHTSDFAGMHGDITLFALPAAAVIDHHLSSKLSDDLQHGQLSGDVIFNGAVSGDLQLAIYDNENCVAKQSWRITEQNSCFCELNLEQPVLWTAETPHCYRAELIWRGDAQGVTEKEKYEQRTSWTIGFKKLTTVDGRPFINGNPIKLRGINFLSVHPEHGLHTPKSWLRQNLELMAKANINCIRTHLTPLPALADLCDEMGFYLLQEVTIDWFSDEIWRTRCLGPCLHRIDGIIRRDRHHPSLIAFGIGNENLAEKPEYVEGFEHHMHIFAGLARKLTSSWIFFPPPGPTNLIPGNLEPRFGDLADVHYNFSSVHQLQRDGAISIYRSKRGPIETKSREKLMQDGWNGSWLSTEYGIVNSVADVVDGPYQSVICDEAEDWLGDVSSTQALANRLEKEWGLMRDDPTCLGGAYFPWMPPGRGETFGWTLWAEDADWGVINQDLSLKPQFWALRAAMSPITFNRNRIVYQTGQESITVSVRNRYSTINLAECTIRCQLGATGKFLGIIRDWKDYHIDCAPGADQEIELPIWHKAARKSLDEGKPTLMRLHVLDPKGFRPLTHEIVLIPAELAQEHQEGHINLGAED